MARAEAAAGRTAGQIKAQFESLNSSFSQLKTVFAGVVAVFAGGEIAAKLAEMAARAEEMRKSSEIFNLSTTALQGLEAMANRAGVSSEYLQRAMTTLEQRMRQAGEQGGVLAERFNAIGISTAELRDPTFSVQDAMERLGASTNSSASLLAVLGARGAQLIPLMRELAQNHNAAAEAAARVGALTEQEIAVLSRYHGQISIVSTEWQNFGSRVFEQVAPALGELQQQLFNIATAGTKTGDLADVARKVSAEFLKWATAAKDLAEDLSYIFTVFGTHLGAMGASMTAALHGDFARAKSISDAEMADLVEIRKKHEERILANHEALAKALVAIDQSVLQPVDVTARYKAKAELPDLSGEFKKREEFLEHWAAEYQSITTHNVMSEDEANTRAVKAANEVEKQREEVAEIGALARVAANEKSLSEQLKDGEVSATQYLAMERANIQQRLAILREYYAGRENGAVEIAKAEAEALQQDQQAQNHAQQALLAQWRSTANNISNAFDRVLGDMLNRGQSFSQSMKSLFASMGEAIIGTLMKVLIQQEINAAISKATGQTAAKSNVLANAAQAASGAMASAAEIPAVGWLLAPIAGAAVYAAALAFPTAERGYDIPAGINPMTQLHAREMVLPPQYADVIRGLADSGGRVDDGGDTHHHHHYGPSLDAKSFNAYIHSKPAQKSLVSAINKAYRRGVRS